MTKQAPFDIRDGRHHYKPCPRCGAEFNMGLTTTTSGVGVECQECGYRGPEASLEDGAWTPEHDRTAFDGWNALPRTDGESNEKEA